MKISSFRPIVPADARLLILGSAPSLQSLAKGQYYGHAQNHFWRLIAELSGSAPRETYEGRVALLHEVKLALWDVVRTCEREGSLDQNIEREEANDIAALLGEYPSISAVAFNGAKAAALYKKHIGLETLAGREVIRLPSSSPIPTRACLGYEAKLLNWRELLGGRLTVS